MPDTPAIAVIGSGYWGKNLVRNYHQLGALRLICDNNETTLGHFRSQYPDLEVCLAYPDILGDTRIGDNCNIGQNVVIGPDVTVGDGCKIQNNVSVYKGVILEDGVFCGPSMVFTNIYNPRAEIRKMDQVRPTLVRHGATLGANCTIVCSVTIGRYGFVGAGAVVNKNVPDHGLVVGNPGKQVGWMCQCGERLTDDLECLSCDRGYRKTERGLEQKHAT